MECDTFFALHPDKCQDISETKSSSEKIMVYWGVTLRSLVDKYQDFARICCLHLQDRRECHAPSLALGALQSAPSAEMSYQALFLTRRYKNKNVLTQNTYINMYCYFTQ